MHGDRNARESIPATGLSPNALAYGAEIRLNDRHSTFHLQSQFKPNRAKQFADSGYTAHFFGRGGGSSDDALDDLDRSCLACDGCHDRVCAVFLAVPVVPNPCAGTPYSAFAYTRENGPVVNFLYFVSLVLLLPWLSPVSPQQCPWHLVPMRETFIPR